MVLLPLSNKEEKALPYSERYFDLLVLESCSVAENRDKTVPTVSIFFCQEIQMYSTNINEATFTMPERHRSTITGRIFTEIILTGCPTTKTSG